MPPTFQIKIVIKLSAFAGDYDIRLQTAYCALIVRNCIIIELKVLTIADYQANCLDSLFC